MKKMGAIEVILSGICFGFLGVFGKKAYLFGINSGELLALRYSISAFMMLIFLLVTRPQIIIINLKDTLISLSLGIFGYALFSSLFFYALTGLSASLTVLLLYTYPIMVAILSRFFLKEHFTSVKIISIILVSLGMYMLVAGQWNISGIQYLLSGIGAAFFYSLYIIYSRKYLTRVAPLTSSFYVQLGAGLILSLIHFTKIERVSFILSNHFFFIGAMAFICSFLAMSLFLSGLQKLTSTETSILSTTEPISAIIIASVVLGERMSNLQITGAVLIISGMVVLGYFKREVE
jgi:drug/metabolite transporter (DMT)-like permease